MMFLPEAAAICLLPYVGGETGAAVLLFVTGACNGLGNVIFLSMLQKWVPPALLGRVMGTLMFCAFGTFPLSVAVAGVLVRHLGPSLFFPLAGGMVAVAILGGLTQREFRAFGSAGTAAPLPARGPPSGAGQEVTAPARSASVMASVTSAVPAVPPTSGVRWPAAVVASIAASTRRASSGKPR